MPGVQRSQWTTDPAATALATMGATAIAAADTWTVQEWAGKLAAQAPPRDYVEQLRALYDDVTRRWRYVQEEGERVPGTPRALLGHVLGAWYNRGSTCEDPERCDVLATTWQQRGFGDCDDVSTLIAAGAIAMGMRPMFRVVRWPGGAHVSTLVETPRGTRVNLDPVGEPEHGFGWELAGQVQLFDMQGRPSSAPLGGHVQPYIVQPQSDLQFAGCGPSYMRGLGGDAQIDDGHVVLTRPGDARGPRVLAIPTWHYRLIAAGNVEDGMPAVDQFGDVYTYDREQDVWVPHGCCEPASMGRRRRRRRRRRFGKRLRRLGRRIARGARKVASSRLAKAYRKAASRLLRSKLVQEAASKGLQALGVPPQATKAVLQREAELAKRGGRARIAAMLAEGKTREAAREIARATGAGIARSVSLRGYEERIPYAGMLAEHDADQGVEFILQTSDGRHYPVAPVAGFERTRGWYGFGQLDVADTPTPGRYYRIKKGDTFAKITTAAYGIGAGQARLRKMREVNNIAYNQRFHKAAPSGEKGFWKNDGNTRISFLPTWSCDAEEQVLAGGGSGDCYAVIYLPVGTEEPPPFEPPQPEPDPDIPEPDEPEEPTVVVPDEPPPEEPPEPDEPEPPPPIPEEPVAPAPPVEPTPPPPDPTPPPTEPPAVPEIEDPAQPEIISCPPGFRFDPATQNCEPLCPEGYVYDPNANVCRSTAAPSCPEGYDYDAVNKVCVPERPTTPPPAIEEPEPPPVVDAPTPAPTPRPTAAGGTGLLLAMIASAATGSPLPLIGMAVVERGKQ